MSEGQRTTRSHRERIIDTLRELVEALDRRVPHVERLGEAVIARDAAALRHEAKQRIEELKADAGTQRVREGEHAVTP